MNLVPTSHLCSQNRRYAFSKAVQVNNLIGSSELLSKTKANKKTRCEHNVVSILSRTSYYRERSRSANKWREQVTAVTMHWIWRMRNDAGRVLKFLAQSSHYAGHIRHVYFPVWFSQNHLKIRVVCFQFKSFITTTIKYGSVIDISPLELDFSLLSEALPPALPLTDTDTAITYVCHRADFKNASEALISFKHLISLYLPRKPLHPPWRVAHRLYGHTITTNTPSPSLSCHQDPPTGVALECSRKQAWMRHCSSTTCTSCEPTLTGSVFFF